MHIQPRSRIFTCVSVHFSAGDIYIYIYIYILPVQLCIYHIDVYCIVGEVVLKPLTQ